ncbi:MAG: beta-L-arabinofuranosidase domain-containing protein [Acidobacteriaceae bacterium]
MQRRSLSRRTFLSLAAGTAAARPLMAATNSWGLLDQPLANGAAGFQGPDWQNQGVMNLAHSPYAKLRNVPVRAVTIEDGFWAKRRTTNVESSIPSMHEELLAHGRMDNFLRLTGGSSAPQRGPVYSDSDIYKWLEAVGFALQSENDAALRHTAETTIHEIVAIQEPNGYIDTYYQDDRKKDRMTIETQKRGHELYCLGHMLQASIATYRATGDRTLMDAGMRYVDGVILPNFGPEADKKPIVSGHPEIEMALIELYRTTGERKYVELAGYILQGDPRAELKPWEIVYMNCGVPFTTKTKLQGHAVRAMYACCGATDYYMETGDPAYWKTLEVLWKDLSQAQMYVTGGVGARSEGESFGDDYELPNAQAYGESCAAIGNMMWNWRMLAATGEARFADVMERALYNGINSGMSLDGKTYCYRNPLAFDPASGEKIRNPWYDTTCCPPNLERTFASLPGYFYSTAKDGLYVHLYHNSEMKWALESGNGIVVTQKTKYPWEGLVRLSVAVEQPEEFTVFVRVPGWSLESQVKVAGTTVAGVQPGEYLPIRRRWSGETVVDLAFDMTPRRVTANPAVAEDTGRVAMERGPLVYCMEGLDQAQSDAKTFPLYMARRSGAIREEFKPDLLDGVMVLTHAGAKGVEPTEALYVMGAGVVRTEPAELKMIPYYAWDNRDESAMQVWVPEG